MAIFGNQQLNVNTFLSTIPEGLLCHLSSITNIDHYSKVLHGKKMFYLLLYGILENDRLSQRSLEDTFNDPIFKTLFNLEEKETVRRSSISERLSKINVDYFQQIYECIFEQFSKYYTALDQKKHNLICVDSSIISDTTGRFVEGMSQGGKKAVKYSIAFDGILPCESEIFTKNTY